MVCLNVLHKWIIIIFFFSQFLLIFRKAAAGELEEDSGLMSLAKLSEIDVSTEGVKGAKHFFEAKVGLNNRIWKGRAYMELWDKPLFSVVNNKLAQNKLQYLYCR